ncbi:hypothetical protein ScPMuIL_001655 [Solemya velum]
MAATLVTRPPRSPVSTKETNVMYTAAVFMVVLASGFAQILTNLVPIARPASVIQHVLRRGDDFRNPRSFSVSDADYVTINGNTAGLGISKTLCTTEYFFLLQTSGDPGISAFPDGDSLHVFRWIATLDGPKGTVYDNLRYKLSLEFPSGYPYQPPTVKFDTPCFHPNVDKHGNICLDILKEKWSALYDVRTILLSIQSLLAEPNNDSPLNTQAADLWSNQPLYKKTLLEKYEKEVKSRETS